MKKVALLLSVLSLALVTGCKEKGPVESPSFASFSKVVSFEFFDSKIKAALNENPIIRTALTEEESATSFSYSGKLVTESKSKKTRNGDGADLTLSETTINVNEDNEGSYDSNSGAFAFVEKYKNVINEKYTGEQESNEQAFTQHINRQFQKAKKEEKDNIAVFNMYLKTCTITDIDATNLATISCKYALEHLIPTIGDFPDEDIWAKYSDTRKADFKFYVDDKTLTMVVNSVVETEQKNTIDGEEKITMKTKTETKRTNQFIVTNKEIKYRFYEATKSSVERIDYFTNKIVNETVTTNYVSSFDGGLKLDNKVSLKLEDPSSYKEGNDNIDFYTA